MKEKGLCLSCIYDSTCSLASKFPVLYCQEFSAEGIKKKLKKARAKKKNAKKHR